MSQVAVLRGCVEVSTAHGFTYALNGKSIFQQIFWLLACLAAMGGFLYYLQKNVVKYQSESTSVSINTQGTNFTPPDLHFCNLSPLSLARIILPSDQDEYNKVDNDTDVLSKRVSVDVDEDEQPEDGQQIFWSSIAPDELFRTVGHLSYQTVLNVTTETEAHQGYFTCFRYRPTGRELKSTTRPLTFTLYYDNYHLQTAKEILKFNGEEVSQLNYFSPSEPRFPAGMVLIFTPPNTYPHIDATSLILGPGLLSGITLRMQNSTSADLRRDPCQSDPDTVDYFNPLLGGNATITYTKTFADCKYAKLLKQLRDKYPQCQCIPYFVPVTLETRKAYRTCANVSDAFNQFDEVNNTIMTMRRKEVNCLDYYYRLDSEFDLQECKDENPCSVTTYIPTISTTTWTANNLLDSIIDKTLRPISDAYEKKNLTAPGFIRYFNDISTNESLKLDLTRYNFAKVMVWAGELKSAQITESVSYDLENLISDVGGIAGLYLGMSFLTLLEFMNLFHDMILLAAAGKNKSKRRGNVTNVELPSMNNNGKSVASDGQLARSGPAGTGDSNVVDVEIAMNRE